MSKYLIALACSLSMVLLTGCQLGRGSKNLDVAQSRLDELSAKVKPSIVRIKVVEPSYFGGREEKFVSSGSGTIITPDGYVVTNHHVAGKAVQLEVTLSNREEMRAELIGTDPGTDIAIIKLLPETPTTFPHTGFGDSDQIKVGDPVIAVGSPAALSQSVTLGVVSNTEMIIPEFYGDSAFELDGENVGKLVRWIGHDAAIYPGNSGGPLMNLKGEIIGVNEIGFALGGAIPGNLAKKVAWQIIKEGTVDRAYTGLYLQPRMKSSNLDRGVLVGSISKESPAEEAELKAGDIILSVNGKDLEGNFAEDLPVINNIFADLAIEQPATIQVFRSGEILTKTITPTRRVPVIGDTKVLKNWGITARDMNIWNKLRMARESIDGVLVTSIRSGGPAAQAKPDIQYGDIITSVQNEEIKNVEQLIEITKKLMGSNKRGVETLVGYERDGEKLLTVLELGIDPLPRPAREVRKGWLPVETQPLTRELVEQLDLSERTSGVRITRVYKQKTEGYPLQVGDIITRVDGERLDVTRPEDSEIFSSLIRQYRIGMEIEFEILRDGEEETVMVETQGSPEKIREMDRYRNLEFEFVARQAAFNDREKPTLQEVEFSVVIDSVTSGGWASLAGLNSGDVLLEVNGNEIDDLEKLEELMESIQKQRAKSVIMFVRRGSQTKFLEIKPSW